MTDQAVPRAAIVVAMPAGIDYGIAEQAYDQLYVAFSADVPVVIADFTLTTCCDGAPRRRLLAIQGRPADRHAELRLAVPPASRSARYSRSPAWTSGSGSIPPPPTPQQHRGARTCPRARDHQASPGRP